MKRETLQLTSKKFRILCRSIFKTCIPLSRETENKLISRFPPNHQNETKKQQPKEAHNKQGG